jgi:predicted transcriptional regulator
MTNPESIFQYVKERLPDPSNKDELDKIAKGSGVPFHTLLKIAKGETTDPRVSTVEELFRYFRAFEAAA